MDSSNKKPWQSRTMLLNGIAGLLAFISLFAPGGEVVKQFLGDHSAEIAMVWSLLNIFLRAITKDKIVLSD